ncbi:basic-leucine zipper transcription factor f-related [Anaeramoeba flamelloides]|uniref:Basic-leucine zipper transcription factor f-related n=1 Tax=Anaeramoeba flamelloides TaxID=1746091 RepID=A0ABQ8XVA5_9EUKA|nr:basic-leucine zipper transcription factor f-related [Anaeramoeba flamelloides]
MNNKKDFLPFFSSHFENEEVKIDDLVSLSSFLDSSDLFIMNQFSAKLESEKQKGEQINSILNDNKNNNGHKKKNENNNCQNLDTNIKGILDDDFYLPKIKNHKRVFLETITVPQIYRKRQQKNKKEEKFKKTRKPISRKKAQKSKKPTPFEDQKNLLEAIKRRQEPVWVKNMSGETVDLLGVMSKKLFNLLTEEQKKRRKKLKNRISAEASRSRAKLRVEALQFKVDDLNKQNQLLLKKVEDFQNEKVLMRNEIEKLRSIVLKQNQN